MKVDGWYPREQALSVIEEARRRHEEAETEAGKVEGGKDVDN